MNKIILHVPHSSLKLPKKFWDFVCVDKNIVHTFNKEICDLKTDKLFGKNCYAKIMPKCSRVFCDVEKFSDDKKEVMSQFGMGVIYTKTNKQVKFFEPTENYKNQVLAKYYFPYHNKMTKVVQKMLCHGDNVILVDCHSFSKDVIMFDDKKQNLPDICVGFNKKNNIKLIDFVVSFFKGKDFTVSKNYPYEGAMVPNEIFESNHFHSVMIEVNKAVYLENKKEFTKMQKCINELFEQIENIEL